MGLNTDQLKPGDEITVEKWLKKMGHVKMKQEDTKGRNALALVRKGKFIAALKCSEDSADTVVNYNGELTPFKRVKLDTTVKFLEDIVAVFPKAFWKKATNTNLFLGMLGKDLEKDLPADVPIGVTQQVFGKQDLLKVLEGQKVEKKEEEDGLGPKLSEES